MMCNLSYYVNRFIKKMLVTGLPWKVRLILGRYLLDEARADNNDDPATNGEYYFLEKLFEDNRDRRIVFDVGANVGEWAEKAASLGKKSTVYAFEPVNESFKVLSSNAGVSIKTFNIALGKEDGEALVYTSNFCAGTNSLVFNDYVGHGSKAEKIAVRTGGGICSENGIDHIDLIKIDTEGFELNVLAGFQSMLNAGRIDFVQFEYGGTWIYSRSLLRDAFILFHKTGYQLGKLHPHHIEVYRQYDPASENYSYSNWIAVRKGVDFPMNAIDHSHGTHAF